MSAVVERSRLQHLRNQPLEPLAQQLGYQRDRSDRRRWRRTDSIISINGARFFDHLAGTGGGGAIDLVMHARKCRFAEAAAFLDCAAGGDWSPPEGMLLPAEQAPVGTQIPEKPKIPARCSEQWPRVRQRLIRHRALVPAILDRCHECGILFADHRANAVFLCRSASNDITGAEIVGTRPERKYRRMAAGSRKSRGGFWIHAGAGVPDAIMLTESAIDALSAHALAIIPDQAAFVSTAGTAIRLPSWINAWMSNPAALPAILCGFDADQAGDDAARSLTSRHPTIARLRPHGGSDWNEILQSRTRNTIADPIR